MDRKRERDKVMATEDLDSLKNIQTWMDKLLNDAESLPSALQNAGLTTESNLAKLSIDRLEFVYSKVKEKIENNEPITAEQDAEQKWEAKENR